METKTLEALLAAIATTWDAAGIQTADMVGEPVRVALGATTITTAWRLLSPERDTQKALKLAQAIEQRAAAALGLPPGTPLTVRVVQVGGYISVEVPNPEPWRPALREVEDLARDALVLGIDQYGRVATLDMLATPPGLFVVGRPGSGKTNAMRLLAAQCVAGWDIRLVDLKGGREWRDIAEHATATAWTSEDAAILLAALVRDIRERNAGATEPTKPILLVFDELPQATPECNDLLAEVVATGRAAGVRVLLGAQRLGRDAGTPIVRAAITARLVGRVSNAQESAEACGHPGLGAEALLGVGDMLLVLDAKPVRRVQVARADVEDVAHLLKGERKQVDIKKVEKTQNLARPRWTWRDVQAAIQADMVRTRGQPPDAWVIARAIEYVGRNGVPPTFALVKAWNKRRTGHGMSDRRAALVRKIAMLAWGYPPP